MILFLVLGLFQARGQWEQVRYRGNMYVTLDSFCEFYSFKHAGTEGEKTTLFNGPYGTLKLTDEGRECYINGRKVWLALNLTTNDSGRRLISYVDVVKMMEPVLRPNKVKKLRPIKGVVIDAGHGGSDNGARGRYGLMEKNMTLDTAKRLERILKAAGIPTVMTRRTDVFIPLEQRAAIAAQYPNYLFVSVHFNQGQSLANGIETFALTPQYAPSTDSAGVMRVSDATRENGNRNDEANILLADFIHQEVRKLHSQDGDRGVKRARFVVLRLNSLPATLVEGGFLSNPGDAKLIGSESYRDKLAGGIAKGVRRFIALSKGDAGTDADEPVEGTGELTRPLPEPPRPLDSKPTAPAKPGDAPKTPATATPAAAKPTDTPKTPVPAPATPASAKTAKPGAAPAPANPAAKTPEPAVPKNPVKNPSGTTPPKPKTPDKPATKPSAKPAEAEDIPQLKAMEPTTTEVIVPAAETAPPPKPSVPVIETAPPPKKPAGPLIETTPAPRPAPVSTAPVIRSTPSAPAREPEAP